MSTLQRPLAGSENLWLSLHAFRQILAEARSKAPYETGGILLGYWAKPTGEPVVTRIIGPGPDAVHERRRLLPDDEYQFAEIARLYQQSNRRLHYLADWHSHPVGNVVLSKRDFRTLRRIAMYPAARVNQPAMLILAHRGDWRSFAWRLERKRKWLWYRWLKVPLLVHTFDVP